MSEIEPRKDVTPSVTNSNALSNTYDGITVHYAADGAVGIGASIDPETLARAAQPAMGEGTNGLLGASVTDRPDSIF